MTPTKQDEELRDKVATIVEYWDFSPLQDEDSRIERLKNEIMQLITADRKRVALEARIDEINYLDDNFQVDSQDWEREHLGYSTAMIPMEDYIRRRTELKAQQEEV